MSRDLMILFAIAMALMVMQMIGGFLQIRRYRDKSVVGFLIAMLSSLPVIRNISLQGVKR